MRTPKNIFPPDLFRVDDPNLLKVFEQFIRLIKENHLNYYEDLKPNVRVFPADDATPSIKDGKVFKTANANPTTITTFEDGQIGQVIIVIINDGNTTIDFTGTNLKGNAGVDWSPAQYDHFHCTYDGTNWHCIVSDNTA